MVTFKYKGISQQGAPINGVIRAFDEYEAVTRLRETCKIINKIEKVTDAEEETAKKKSLKIKDKDLAIMCSQFSIILSAGMPLVKCIEMVAAQADNRMLGERLEKVADDVAGGLTLAQAFSEHLPMLPTTFIETVRAGEQAGAMEECFKRLNKYYDNSAKTKGKVVSALIYPIIVIVVAIVVFFIIMTVAVPSFTTAFADLGTELPFITKAMMAASAFMTKSWWIIVVIAAILGMLYMLIRRTEAGKRGLAEYGLTKSPFSKIRLLSCANTFASTLSTMLSSGLSIVRALEITSSVVGNYVYSLAVYQVKEDVEQGESIAASMRKHPCFSKLMTEMTAVGERTGAMEQTLDVVSDYYGNELQMQTQRLISMMEPVITIVLAVVTCILLLGIYLPMFSLYGSM